jgi:type IV pilus assembly protein PilB
LPIIGQNAYTLFQGRDKPESPGGYKGRLGLYEVFNISDEIQNLIINQATSAEIQKMAQAQGMVTMRQDGYLKALAGLTTLNEVNRVAATDGA